MRTIAFPAISTGVYGYPIELAAKVVLETLAVTPAPGIQEVRLVLFSAADLEVYKAAQQAGGK